jgi:Alpha/beta hydrolase domain
LARTGAAGSADLPLPQNVRMYDIAGAAHLNVRQQNKACREPHGQLDWSPALRAQLIAFDEWVRQGTAPPASLLMPLEPRPDPTALPVPSYLPQATIMLPKLDADGNAIGGLRLPDLEVPIATYGNLNAPLTHVECLLAGTYRPFAKTAADRQSLNDARLSLQERYPGGINEYTSKVRIAAKRLVAERLLLEEDGVIIAHTAAENPSFQPTTPRPRWSTPH